MRDNICGHDTHFFIFAAEGRNCFPLGVLAASTLALVSPCPTKVLTGMATVGGFSLVGPGMVAASLSVAQSSPGVVSPGELPEAWASEVRIGEVEASEVGAGGIGLGGVGISGVGVGRAGACENYAVVTLFFLNFPYLLQDLLS